MTPSFVLIGPPGSGKSSIGRSLARSLNQDFSDTDNVIEAEQGRPISQIFFDDGEPHFRAIEERICLTSLKDLSGVVSLGGGAILSKVVSEALTAGDFQVIFLDVSLAVAAPRIGFNRDRPLLLGNPRQQWQKLMDDRRPMYESLASVQIVTGNRSVGEIVKEILETVKQK